MVYLGMAGRPSMCLREESGVGWLSCGQEWLSVTEEGLERLEEQV